MTPSRGQHTHSHTNTRGTSPKRARRWVYTQLGISLPVYIYIYCQVRIEIRVKGGPDILCTVYYKLFKRSKCYRFRSFGHTPRVTIFVHEKKKCIDRSVRTKYNTSMANTFFVFFTTRTYSTIRLARCRAYRERDQKLRRRIRSDAWG